MSIAQHVFQKTLNLSEDQQRRVLAFVESLPVASVCAPLVDPFGMFAGASSDLDLADFQQARADVWERLPRDLP